MKEIKIVLTHTNTVVCRTLKAFSKKPYNHISISFEDDCSTMFSFGRKITWFPLVGGFIKEDINSGVFKMHPETKCKIYKFEVTDEDYDIITRRLNDFLAKPHKYRYSFLNVFLIRFNIPYQREHHFVCSSFVSYLLKGVIPFNKEISLIIPDDYNNFNLIPEYEGRLFEYVSKKVACVNA